MERFYIPVSVIKTLLIFLFLLIGNKIDLEKERHVSVEEAEAYV